MGAKIKSCLVCGATGSGAIRLGPARYRYYLQFTDLRDGKIFDWGMLDVPADEEVTFDRAGIQLQNGGSIPNGLDLEIDEIGGSNFFQNIDTYDRQLDHTLQGDKRFQFTVTNQTSDYQTTGAFVDVIIQGI